MDDDPGLTGLYVAALTPEGWSVVTARRFDEALHAAIARPPDMMILDTHLPDESGFALAARLRAEPRLAETPLLFISGTLKAARHRAAVIDQFGAIDFLEKPVPPGELAARIRIAVGPERPVPPRPEEAPVTVGGGAGAGLGAALSTAGGSRTDLAVKPFHEVLAELARNRSSGYVSVRREKVRKFVSIRHGWPVGLRSNLLSDCLGRVLVRAGTITDEQCERSLERMRTTGRPQGQALIELGHLTPRMLEDALELQLELKLFDLFGWDSGECHFVPREGDETQQTVIRMSPTRIIFEGLSRTSDEARLRRLLRRPHEGRLSIRWSGEAHEAIETLANPAQVRPFVAALDGSRTIDEVLDTRMLPSVRGLSLIVALCELGLAELVTPMSTTMRKLRQDEALVEPTDPDARDQLVEQLDKLARATHYQALGLPRAASSVEIADALRTTLAPLSLDSIPVRGSLRGLAQKLHERLQLAHDTLIDPASRAAYDATIPETDEDAAERILRADEAFRAGRVEFDRARYAAALRHFTEAREHYPEEAAFHAWLAIARWQVTPDAATAAVALASIDHARKLHPRLPEAPLFASHIRRGMGDTAAAAAELARAHALSAPVGR